MRSSFKQLNILWEHYFARAGKQKCRIDDVFKSLLRDKIPKDKFFYVTEYWLDQLSSSYATGLTIPPMFDEPAMSYHLILRKTPTFDYIKKIVTQMKYPPTFKVDDYTRMLIKFARRDGIKYEEILLTRAVELVDTEALHNHYPDSCPEEESESPLKDLDVKLMYFFEYLIQDLKSDVNEWISGVLTPLHALLRPINAADEPENYLFISANVYELIEVAELRRKAVGSRFISRNHLMWAFYECGYGLPPKIRKSINLNTDHDDDEDHPPYHVYMTSIKLAESFEEKKLLLEHFVFVILYMKDVDIDDEM
ncbi:uncharacterized protein LOC141596524 [Silene latifolia]|uniref:uncharacterized protein LOC141596524 n=1 Tax=Silene latifolia TaxID=37657 RepID=UPI003D786842